MHYTHPLKRTLEMNWLVGLHPFPYHIHFSTTSSIYSSRTMQDDGLNDIGDYAVQQEHCPG
jgi:hypothetical protein